MAQIWCAVAWAPAAALIQLLARELTCYRHNHEKKTKTKTKNLIASTHPTLRFDHWTMIEPGHYYYFFF